MTIILTNQLQFFKTFYLHLSYISGEIVQNAIRNRFSQLGKSICKINVITNMHIQAFMTVRHDKSKGRIQGILTSFKQEFSSESQKKCRQKKMNDQRHV